MNTYRKFYFLGFIIFIFSFFLPATMILTTPVTLYEIALDIFSSLFKSQSILEYLFALFLNLSNILTILVFILQFKFSLNKLFVFQLIAFISAFYWVASFQDLSYFYIGYWIWLFSLIFMSIVMIIARKPIEKT